jgi:hypothetical protein
MDPVVHFEMPAEDKKRTAEFYTNVFGWKMVQLGSEMGDYLLAHTTEMDEKMMPKKPGTINGGFFNKGEYDSIPHIVIAVENLDESMNKIKESGGKVLGEPREIPGIGMFIMFKDTEGNKVGMLQPKEM